MKPLPVTPENVKALEEAAASPNFVFIKGEIFSNGEYFSINSHDNIPIMKIIKGQIYWKGGPKWEDHPDFNEFKRIEDSLQKYIAGL